MKQPKEYTISNDSAYAEAICAFLKRELPHIQLNQHELVAFIYEAITSSAKYRLTPIVNPFIQVSMMNIIAEYVAAGRPIPFLVPWGSRKANGNQPDIAELFALKSLDALNKRIMERYPEGIDAIIRIEDLGGLHLYGDTCEMRQITSQYADDMQLLTSMITNDYVEAIPESKFAFFRQFKEQSTDNASVIYSYMTGTPIGTTVAKEADLKQIGWKGTIPQNQRDYYLARYDKLYPGSTVIEKYKKLADYFGAALTRYQLGMTGARKCWDGKYIRLSFVPPIPGADLHTDNSVYYRTIPKTFTRESAPPWRVKGYLKLEGNIFVPKIITPHTMDAFEPNVVEFTRDGKTVRVQADILEHVTE